MEIDLLQYEKDLISRGYEYICGIDEAGRGPLAGPGMRRRSNTAQQTCY